MLGSAGVLKMHWLLLHSPCLHSHMQHLMQHHSVNACGASLSLQNGVNYVGRAGANESGAPAPCSYMLGVYNKEKGELKVSRVVLPW